MKRGAKGQKLRGKEVVCCLVTCWCLKYNRIAHHASSYVNHRNFDEADEAQTTRKTGDLDPAGVGGFHERQATTLSCGHRNGVVAYQICVTINTSIITKNMFVFTSGVPPGLLHSPTCADLVSLTVVGPH